MVKKVWAVVLLSIISCSTTRIEKQPIHIEAKQSIKELEDKCTPKCDNIVGDIIACPRDVFFNAGLSFIDALEDLELCNVLIDECRQLSSVDVQECNSRVFECQEKLDSPWRSPWLWTAIGFVVGAGVMAGVAISK